MEMSFITKSMFMIFTIFIVDISLLSTGTEAQRSTIISRCLKTTTSAVNNTNYLANRDDVFSSLSSAASAIRGDGFHIATSGRRSDMVYGLFLCRGDVSTGDCNSCITMAIRDISRLCPVETSAVVWYEDCLLRYSNQNIFTILAEEPVVSFPTSEYVTEEHRFNQQVTALLNDTATQATDETQEDAKKFATGEAKYSINITLYTLAQCTPDLSATDCIRCLQGAIANLSSCCSGVQGAVVLKPSCNLRYQTYKFYNQSAVAAPPPEGEKQNESNWTTILVATLSATFGLALVSVSGFFIWKKIKCQEDRENSQEAQLLDLVEGRIPNDHSRETFSGENVGRSQEFPSIHLDLLHSATNHFSVKNRLGEGGFGPVYKGTLADGKEIAVKRLSRTSGQGLVEFKNEVMLIAKLQHRNLVRLLGCCLENNEKLLVYEFMPNRSLDVFLFDSNLAVQLDWPKRFNIIKGIARGVMYLHEDSRLRIIHRDLKASNVLLDHEMNPKISDFGMARIFEDKNEANTNRVVGTYGYMAPEYAMHGLFSIKSDVFSFGVLLLEIISGKKNNNFHLSESGESLLTFAWKLWSKGEGMEIIDRLLVPSCVAPEVHKCIHIGLLCVQEDPADRPTMSSVVFMLASDSTITLPRPSLPVFSVGRAVANSSEPFSNDGAVSVNDVTISNFSPR